MTPSDLSLASGNPQYWDMFMMNAAGLSTRAWVILILLLYILCELNAIECGMRLVNSAPTSPLAATGQVVALPVGTRGVPSLVFVTAREKLIYNFWLTTGMTFLVMGLGLLFGHGVRLALAERRANLSRAENQPHRGDPRS